MKESESGKAADRACEKAEAAVYGVDTAIHVAEKAIEQIDEIGAEEAIFAVAKAQEALDGYEKLVNKADAAASAEEASRN
jgi:hypothetical protein